MTGVDWARIGRLVADGVAMSRGDRVSVFVTDTSVMDAAVAFADEGWRRGAVIQVVATDERFDAGALRWADVGVLEAPMPLEALAMEWSDVHVSFRAMTHPVVDADPRRIAALRRGRGVVSTMRWQGTRWALVRVPTPAWAEAMGVDAGTVLREWDRSFDADWADAAQRMQDPVRPAGWCTHGRHRGRLGRAGARARGPGLGSLRRQRELARRRGGDRTGRDRGRTAGSASPARSRSAASSCVTSSSISTAA